jgi:hypothetical protein
MRQNYNSVRDGFVDIWGHNSFLERKCQIDSNSLSGGCVCVLAFLRSRETHMKSDVLTQAKLCTIHTTTIFGGINVSEIAVRDTVIPARIETAFSLSC